jgi:hypothetical protein
MLANSKSQIKENPIGLSRGPDTLSAQGGSGCNKAIL